MHTDGSLHVNGCKKGEIQVWDGQTDRHTDRGQVHVLSCAFAAKNSRFMRWEMRSKVLILYPPCINNQEKRINIDRNTEPRRPHNAKKCIKIRNNVVCIYISTIYIHKYNRFLSANKFGTNTLLSLHLCRQTLYCINWTLHGCCCYVSKLIISSEIIVKP